MSPYNESVVHEAIQAGLGEGELAVCWVLVVDVAGPDDTRYLAHRAGGGHDGSEAPMAWTALGMMTAARDLAAEQVLGSTHPASDPDEDDPGEG